MRRFVVSTQGAPPLEVDALNWLTALGIGLDQLGAVSSLDRLACEVMPNGKVIARDVRTGAGFVVEPADVAHPDFADTAFFETPIVEIEEDEEAPHDALDGSDDLLMMPDEDTDAIEPELDALLTQISESETDLRGWQLALCGAHLLIPSESGAALTREDDGGLRFIDAIGPRSRQVLGRRIPPNHGIAGFCVERKVNLLIREPDRDPRFFASIDHATGYHTRSVLAVSVGDAGCLELLNPPDEFTPDQLDSFSLIADELAEVLTRLA